MRRSGRAKRCNAPLHCELIRAVCMSECLHVGDASGCGSLCYDSICYDSICYESICYDSICYDSICYDSLCYDSICYASATIERTGWD